MHGGLSAMQDLEPMKLESFVANLTLVIPVRMCIFMRYEKRVYIMHFFY